MDKSIVREKSFDLAFETAKVCIMLSVTKKEFVISKQLMRSATSIGANVREALNAVSDKDFIYKLSISQKECDETLYWLELLKKLELISSQEFPSLENQTMQVFKIIKSIIITKRSRMPQTNK